MSPGSTALPQCGSPLFEPLQVRNVRFSNRMVIPPMNSFMASSTGEMSDLHFALYAAFILGGAGLVIVESVAFNPNYRERDNQIGMYNPKTMEMLKKLADLAHGTRHGCKFGVQMVHGGRIAGLKGNREPVDDWERYAPSPIPYTGVPTPTQMSEAEMKAVKQQWALAARSLSEIGVDYIEIHGAHGFLLHQFLSPLSNRRGDGYGGDDFHLRIKYPTEIIRAVREAVPASIPVGIRLSASDLAPAGQNSWNEAECAKFCQHLEAEELVEIFSISCAGLIKEQDLSKLDFMAPGYQVPYAHGIKQTLRKSTSVVMVAGNIATSELANQIVKDGKTDMVCVGREALRNPRFGFNWAVELGAPVSPPPQLAAGYMMSKMKAEMMRQMKAEQEKSAE